MWADSAAMLASSLLTHPTRDIGDVAGIAWRTWGPTVCRPEAARRWLSIGVLSRSAAEVQHGHS